MSQFGIVIDQLLGRKFAVVDDRKKAIEELAKVTESSKIIVLALMVAKDSDTDPEVRTMASQALQVPVHQDILSQNPGLTSEANAIVRGRLDKRTRQQTEAVQPGRPVYKPRRARYSRTRGWGVFLLFAGVVSLILPLFGRQLMLFYVIPTNNPFCGILLLIVGGVVFLIDLVSDPT